MKKLIVANWKMQLSVKESLTLAKKLVAAHKTAGGKGAKNEIVENEIVICPDYAALPYVAPILKNTRMKLGAQDSAGALKGAYTGEVSPLSLKALGVKYVILGHSERREHLHENSAIINAKIKAALESGLTPILCIGEKWPEREAGQTETYLLEQLQHGLKDIKVKNTSDLVIAYEPVWAISSNKNAKPLAPTEADEIQKFIKNRTTKILKKKVRVLYGGSVDAKNAAGFLLQDNIDGLLVGGASLRADEFEQICRL